MNPYGDLILEHFRRPRNYGSLEHPQIRSEEFNPFCGDRVRVELALAPDGTVSTARFQGDLCMIAKAAASILTELVTGRPLDAVEAFRDSQMIEALRIDIRPARMKCALLALVAVQSGVKGYRFQNLNSEFKIEN